MKWIRLRRRRRDPRIVEELRFHRDRLVEDDITAGMTRAEAERRAFLEFGNAATIEELYAMYGTLARRFRKRPGLRVADASPQPWILLHRRPVACFRHRRQRCDLQPGQLRDAAGPPGSRAGPPRPDYASPERAPRPGVVRAVREYSRQRQVDLRRLCATVRHADRRR